MNIYRNNKTTVIETETQLSVSKNYLNDKQNYLFLMIVEQKKQLGAHLFIPDLKKRLIIKLNIKMKIFAFLV